MSDEQSPAITAGSMLRKAREVQGLHIAALATALKIPPRKLELLERDQYDQLPDIAFVRALAKSACRALKIDAEPVMALLPRPDVDMLDQVGGGLNMPFRDRSMGVELSIADVTRAPAFWVVVLLLVAAAAVYFWPAGSPVVSQPERSAGPAEVAAPASVAASDAPVMPPDVAASDPSVAGGLPVPATAPPDATASAPTAAAAPSRAAAASAAPAVAALLQLRASEKSWVQVTDANGRSLLSRALEPGETLGLDGALPLRVVVGNVAGTQLSFRGVAVDLTAGTRDNVARLELR